MNRPEHIPQATEEFIVGGVKLPRPFRIRRLGHFGVNVADPDRSRDFYCRLLGFRISDPLDFGERVPQEAIIGIVYVVASAAAMLMNPGARPHCGTNAVGAPAAISRTARVTATSSVRSK